MIVYYKMRQVLLQNATAILLQNATGFLLQNTTVITKCDDFITKCDSYYKIRRLYCKMGQLLQNATFITNCSSTLVPIINCVRSPYSVLLISGEINTDISRTLTLTVPNSIIVGYVCHIFGSGPFCSPPRSVSSFRKAHPE